MWLMIMKRRLKMKNRLHRCNINSPRPRQGPKYTKYKMCFSMMMAKCIKQHPSNISSSIREKVRQHLGWVAKKLCLYKKACIFRKVYNIRFLIQSQVFEKPFFPLTVTEWNYLSINIRNFRSLLVFKKKFCIS